MLQRSLRSFKPFLYFFASVEDYQDANQDHMSMFKPVPLDSSSNSVEEAVIRFSHVVLPQNSQVINKHEEEAESPSKEATTNGNCEVNVSKHMIILIMVTTTSSV